ncbi:hypothetical protein EYF80_027656 [Liparis tanakae]|uniref:Uncharacterized protein n=1 Tax=Liparis tanakae TaxID=230148 RepID=A0A4Z2H8R0_9TELE|nr:hypothetical protein EYF80_027656 [Liparis tanakae]
MSRFENHKVLNHPERIGSIAVQPSRLLCLVQKPRASTSGASAARLADSSDMRRLFSPGVLHDAFRFHA